MTNEENLNELNLCSWFSNILRGIFLTVWKCHSGINIRNEELPRVVFKCKANSITEYKQSLYFAEWFWLWVGSFLYFKFSSTEEGKLQSRLFYCVIVIPIWKNKTSDFKGERKGVAFVICGMGGWHCGCPLWTAPRQKFCEPFLHNQGLWDPAPSRRTHNCWIKGGASPFLLKL